jgi:NADH pyrophosphatase NudC (nudix superfamily)
MKPVRLTVEDILTDIDDRIACSADRVADMRAKSPEWEAGYMAALFDMQQWVSEKGGYNVCPSCGNPQEYDYEDGMTLYCPHCGE